MSDLRPTHIEIKNDNGKGKLIAGAVIALAIIAGGAYFYETGAFAPAAHYAVSDSQLPQPSLPVLNKS